MVIINAKEACEKIELNKIADKKNSLERIVSGTINWIILSKGRIEYIENLDENYRRHPQFSDIHVTEDEVFSNLKDLGYKVEVDKYDEIVSIGQHVPTYFLGIFKSGGKHIYAPKTCRMVKYTISACCGEEKEN